MSRDGQSCVCGRRARHATASHTPEPSRGHSTLTPDGDAERATGGDSLRPTDADAELATGGDSQRATGGYATRATCAYAEHETGGHPLRPSVGDAEHTSCGYARHTTGSHPVRPSVGDALRAARCRSVRAPGGGAVHAAGYDSPRAAGADAKRPFRTLATRAHRAAEIAHCEPVQGPATPSADVGWDPVCPASRARARREPAVRGAGPPAPLARALRLTDHAACVVREPSPAASWTISTMSVIAYCSATLVLTSAEVADVAEEAAKLADSYRIPE